MTTEIAGHIPELTLGWRLRMAMESSSLDQSQWAQYLGVNRNTITRWTHDKSPVARGHLVAISLRTGVPMEWIEHGTGPSNNGDGGDGLPRLDSNQQPSGYRPRRHRQVDRGVLVTGLVA
jgi:transcriptional regulator with XRE-family HTH domain